MGFVRHEGITWELVDPPDGQEQVVRDTLSQIEFPWQRIADYVSRDPDDAVVVVWRDLGQQGSALYLDHRVEIHLNTRYGLDHVPFSLTHEIGHLVDYALLDDGRRGELLALMHETPGRWDGQELNGEEHPWSHRQDHVESWWDRSNDYKFRPHESFADLFVFVFAPPVREGRHPRFVHWTGDFDRVRRIVLREEEDPVSGPFDLTRRDWNADPPRHDRADPRPFDRFESHHTVGTYGTTPDDREGLAQLMREIQNDHQHSRGWNDVFYHAVIGFSGLIAEGRAAHDQAGELDGTFTVCFAGNYEHRQLNRAQKRAWHRLKGWVAEQGRAEIRRHDERYDGECPGDNVIGWLRAGAPLDKETIVADLYAYGRRGTPDLAAAQWAVQAARYGTATWDPEEAREAARAGIQVVAVGGPASDDLEGEDNVFSVRGSDAVSSGKGAADAIVRFRDR